MIFDEVYSSSFRIIGKILNCAIEQNGLSPTSLRQIILEETFNEVLADKIRSEIIVDHDNSLFKTTGSTFEKKYIPNFKHKYERPMTTVELQWLRSMIDNPRIRLFVDEENISNELKEVEPLFNWEDVLYYDQFADADNFNDSNYINNFRLLLSAIKQKAFVQVKYGKMTFKCFPRKLEYSQRDDKFRLLNSGIGEDHKVGYLRLSKIEDVKILELNNEFDSPHYNKDIEKLSVTVLVSEENNTKERFLLHFAPYQRETIKYGENLWEVKISYDADMELEMINKIMSFGHFVKVIGPQEFKNAIKDKLSKQKALFSNF